MSIEGKAHDNEASFFNHGEVGDWMLVRDHICIETPGGTAVLPIDEKCREEWGGPCWQWDGNREAPTITPSIQIRGSQGEWHGWMTEGKLVTA